VASLNGITSVSGGDRHAIARLADGSVVASGSNSQKQLGSESTVLPSSKVFVKVNGIGPAVSVAANSNSSYAVMSDGSVLAWGADSGGSLGNGIPSSAPQLPKPVLIASNSQLSSVISLEARLDGVAALRSDGAVFGWGSNSSGIIPGSLFQNTYFAKAITGLPSISKLGSDDASFYALARNGSVWSWGSGSTAAAVIQIPGLPKIIDLTRVSFGTLAWAADGRRFILLGGSYVEFPY
jgi:alpha-tubulin suppressor-like RCC1 family protein